MSYGTGASLKTAINTLINGAGGIDTASKVWKCQRQFTDDASAKAILLEGDALPINAWFISIVKMNDAVKSFGQSGLNKREYTVEVLHYASIDDVAATPSEAVVEERTEKFMDAINKSLRPLLPAGSHVLEYPKCNLGYTLFQTGGSILVHRVGILFSVEIWDSRA